MTPTAPVIQRHAKDILSDVGNPGRGAAMLTDARKITCTDDLCLLQSPSSPARRTSAQGRVRGKFHAMHGSNLPAVPVKMDLALERSAEGLPLPRLPAAAPAGQTGGGTSDVPGRLIGRVPPRQPGARGPLKSIPARRRWEGRG